MPSIGSVTGIDPALLRPDVILCAGEVLEELRHALAGLGPCRAERGFRCYRIMVYDTFCVIWSAIGTGCMEPLLFELLRHAPAERRPRRIVLVGTAGALGGSVELGRAYPVARAVSVHTALDEAGPAAPRWDGADLADGKSSVSTDFFYGFSPKPGAGEYLGPGGDPAWAARLAERFAAHRHHDLVEMEVAQFYFLCGQFAADHVQYLAFKGASNPVTDLDAQTEGSMAVLADAVRRAARVLGLAYEPA